jgi:hypothetical protein
MYLKKCINNEKEKHNITTIHTSKNKNVLLHYSHKYNIFQ